MSEKKIDVRVTANTSGVEQGMDKAAKSVEDGAKRMDGSFRVAGDSMSGVSTTIRSAFASVAAIAAAAFSFVAIKNAADETVKYTEAAIDLGRAMGVSATEASVWVAVLDDIGASQGELSAASRGLTTKLRENEEALNQMGLKTRDANGKLRPMNDLMHDGIAVVNSYREGTDRNAAAQEMFGRSLNGSSKLLQASREKAEETKKKMEELGIVVGQEDVAAWKRYDDASDDANLTMNAVEMTIGRALIPVLSALKEKLVSIGPALVKMARVAMETFLGVVDLVRMVKQAVTSVGSDIGATAAAAAFALRGDFTGAMNVFKARASDAIRETQRLKDLWNGTGDSFLGKFRQPKTEAGKSNEGEKDFQSPSGAPGKKGKGARAANDQGPDDIFDNGSFVTSDKGSAEFIKQQFEAVNGLQREMVKDAEKAANDAAEADKKAYASRTSVALLWANNAAAAQLSVIDSAQAAAQQQYDLGAITYQQLLAQEVEYEQQRNAIRLQALNDRLAQLQLDPERNPEAIAQAQIAIEELERQHQANMTTIKNGAELERSQYQLSAISGIQSALQNSFQQLLMGQATMAQTLKSIWAGVLSTITGLIAKFAAEWIAKKLAMMLFGKTTAVSEIATQAARAGAGGVASWAAAPWPINVGAPAFGAAMYAASMAFAPAASAAGGYDIPAGVNPLTQLHEEEMVLPKRLANNVRKMTGEGVAKDEGGTAPVEIHIHQNIKAWDSVDARRAMMDNQPALVEALKNAHRNGFK